MAIEAATLAAALCAALSRRDGRRRTPRGRLGRGGPHRRAAVAYVGCAVITGGFDGTSEPPAGSSVTSTASTPSSDPGHGRLGRAVAPHGPQHRRRLRIAARPLEPHLIDPAARRRRHLLGHEGALAVAHLQAHTRVPGACAGSTFAVTVRTSGEPPPSSAPAHAADPASAPAAQAAASAGRSVHPRKKPSLRPAPARAARPAGGALGALAGRPRGAASDSTMAMILALELPAAGRPAARRWAARRPPPADRRRRRGTPRRRSGRRSKPAHSSSAPRAPSTYAPRASVHAPWPVPVTAHPSDTSPRSAGCAACRGPARIRPFTVPTGVSSTARRSRVR